MSRTAYRPKWKGYSYETLSYRRAHMKKWKARCRQAMRVGRWDDLPVKKGTEGWLTW